MSSTSVQRKREQNEKKFGNWVDLPDYGRQYWYDVPGRHGWLARYAKGVDMREETVSFRQEIFDAEGNLVETHQKYPVDLGHRPAGES